MVGYRTVMPWLKNCALICALALPTLAFVPQAAAQTVDPDAPYADAYDVMNRGRLVGSWRGTISGSSISQADGQMEGQARVMGHYEGSNALGLVLHDHRHRSGLDFSEISIAGIPCGPDGAVMQAIDPVEFQHVPAGAYASVHFINRLADTGRDDFEVGVGGWYGAGLDNPASLQTRWSDDGFTLRLTGRFKSIVYPVRNHTLDYERLSEGYHDHIHLDVEFTIANSPENQGALDLTLCEEPDVFEVVRTEPMHGRENVILEGADFFVEFSGAVAESSLDPSTVTMTTRDENNGLIFVDLELGLEDERGMEDEETLRIAPREPLRSGTIYEISVAGGEAGLRGSDRQVLEEDYTFSVSTMVDPEEMRFGIYQVSRDSPLVYGKPAVARIELDWEELEDIHPDWQVLDYPVLAEVLDTRETTIFPEIYRRVERPDQYNDEDRRLGEHTLNLFEWTPTRARDPRDFRAEVRPANPYPEDVEIAPEVVEKWVEYAARHTDLLTIGYYIAEHAEWGDGGPSQDMILHIHHGMRRERTFINQMFPVARVATYFQGSYNVEELVCSLPKLSERYCPQNHQNLGMLFQLFDEHLSAHSTADVLVSYHPPSLEGTGAAFALYEQPGSLIYRPGEPHRPGEAHPDVETLRRSDRGNRNMVVMSTSTVPGGLLPAIVTVPLIAHEVGHVFALPHSPYADDGAHRAEICGSYQNSTAAGIDGMRIALSGDTGWQKSSEDGNAETTVPMRNLMFPCAFDPREEYWIDPAQYEWLVEKLPEILNTLRRERAQLPTPATTRHAQMAGPLHELLWQAAYREGEDQEERWLMISGLMDEHEAVLLPAVSVSGPRTALSGDGPYEIHVEDAFGRVLARAPVGPGQHGGAWPFSVSVPVRGEPARIVLSLDGEVLDENRAASSLIAPEARSHGPGVVYRAGDTLEWDSGPSDGLTYTVRFAANGEDWTTLAVLLSEPRFTPDPNTLGPGSNPAFEIVAHDGVTERATRLPVVIDVPLEPLAVWPEDGALIARGETAQIAFNVPIDIDTLDAVTLEAENVLVPAHVALDPSGMIVTITPQEPDADTVYTAIADTSLAAVDGRSIRNVIRISFTAEPPEPPMAATAGDVATLEGSPGSGDAAAADAEIAGVGEIILELGQTLTVPAQILRCAANEDERLSRLEITFETTPGDWVDITMSRDADDVLTVQMALSNGAQFSNQGSGDDGWHFRMEGEQVSAQAHVGGPGEEVGFTLSGECHLPL